ncbi:MAG: arsenic resistance protein [Sulfurovaceae bacterium]|nr:arsenic resistance protein [Sulfurovaceae bacterium]
MWKFLSIVQKNLIWSITLMLVAGIIFGYLFDMSFLKPIVLPLTFLMVYPMMINFQIEKIFSLTGIKAQTTTQAINFLIIPFIALGIGNLFFADNPMLILGLLLIALIPTSGMTISWTGFAKGNMDLAIKMTVIGLIIGSIATPVYMKAFMGTTVEIPTTQIFSSIAIIVFLPAIFGYLTRKFLLKRYGQEYYKKNLKQKFPLLSTLGVLGIVFVAMSLKAESIIETPEVIITYSIPLIIFYLINFSISTIIGKFFFNRGDAIAIVYGTVMRNLSISLAIAMTVFAENGSEIAILIALAFIIQVKMAAWYVKFTDRFFGDIKG